MFQISEELFALRNTFRVLAKSTDPGVRREVNRNDWLREHRQGLAVVIGLLRNYMLSDHNVGIFGKSLSPSLRRSFPVLGRRLSNPAVFLEYLEGIASDRSMEKIEYLNELNTFFRKMHSSVGGVITAAKHRHRKTSGKEGVEKK